MGVPSKGKAKGKPKTMPKTTPRDETAHVRSRKANVRVEIRAHSSMNQTGKAKASLLHLLRQVHRTGIRKVMAKVVMTEAQRGSTPTITGKSPSGEQTDSFCFNFKKGSCQNGNSCTHWHTTKFADEKKTLQLLQFT